jgi:hypothetical protein
VALALGAHRHWPENGMKLWVRDNALSASGHLVFSERPHRRRDSVSRNRLRSVKVFWFFSSEKNILAEGSFE